jgi:hypothetical protein
MGMFTVAQSRKSTTFTPLGMRKRAASQKREQVLRMIEDYDAREDLSVEPDLSDIPDWAWTIFGVNVAVDQTETDDEEDWKDQLEQLVWMSEQNEPLQVADKYELKYWTLFPHLWAEETYEDSRYEEELYCDELEELARSFGPDNWEFFYPEWCDDGEDIPMPTQGSFNYDTRLMEHSWWSLRKAERYRQSAGKHGRDKTTVWQKEREANRKIRKTSRTVEGKQQIAAENDWMVTNYWSPDMVDFDGEITFWADTPSGRLGEAYRRLLTVNHIIHELKDEWLREYGEWDEYTEDQHFLDEMQMEDEGIDHPYHFGEYAVRPEYDWISGGYTHPKLSNHGWGYMNLSYRDQQRFLENERQEDRLREMADEPTSSFDCFRTSEYYDGGWDDYVGPSLSLHNDEDWDEAEERKKDDDKRFQQMADAESDGWTEIDEALEAEQRDAVADAATIAQHGGARGWKAGKVARLRQTELV